MRKGPDLATRKHSAAAVPDLVSWLTELPRTGFPSTQAP
jgi:hypothetical protein